MEHEAPLGGQPVEAYVLLNVADGATEVAHVEVGAPDGCVDHAFNHLPHPGGRWEIQTWANGVKQITETYFFDSDGTHLSELDEFVRHAATSDTRRA